MAPRGGSSKTPSGRKGGGSSKARASKGGSPVRKPAAKPAAKPTRKPKPAPAPPPAAPPMPAQFSLGTIPGATPGKWIDVWQERFPQSHLALVQVDVAGQERALRDGDVDAALVRLPIGRSGLDVIALYDELPVVVAAADSHLMAADGLTFDDLAGEVLVIPLDDALGCDAPGTVAPNFAPPVDTAEAVATIAAGIGILIVPMSLARLHHRKDIDYRVLEGGPTSTVALAWPSEQTTPAVEAFIGIVRGRTANSSRG